MNRLNEKILMVLMLLASMQLNTIKAYSEGYPVPTSIPAIGQPSYTVPVIAPTSIPEQPSYNPPDTISQSNLPTYPGTCEQVPRKDEGGIVNGKPYVGCTIIARCGCNNKPPACHFETCVINPSDKDHCKCP